MMRRVHDVTPVGIQGYARNVAIDLLDMELGGEVDHVELVVSRRGGLGSISVRGTRGVETVFEDEWREGSASEEVVA